MEGDNTVHVALVKEEGMYGYYIDISRPDGGEVRLFSISELREVLQAAETLVNQASVADELA